MRMRSSHTQIGHQYASIPGHSKRRCKNKFYKLKKVYGISGGQRTEKMFQIFKPHVHHCTTESPKTLLITRSRIWLSLVLDEYSFCVLHANRCYQCSFWEALVEGNCTHLPVFSNPELANLKLIRAWGLKAWSSMKFHDVRPVISQLSSIVDHPYGFFLMKTPYVMKHSPVNK